MPSFDTVEQRLPIGFHHKGVWYNTVRVREMIGSDSQYLASSEARNNAVKGTTTLLSNLILEIHNSETDDCISKVTREMVRDMYIADRDMAMLAVRKVTHGDYIPVSFRCRNEDCKCENEFEFDLSLIKTKYSPDFPPNVETHVELPKGIVWGDRTLNSIWLTYLRGREQEMIAGIARTNPGEAANALIHYALTKIDQFDMAQKSVSLVSDLRAKDVDAILQAIQTMQLGPDLNATIDCADCGTEHALPLGNRMLSVSA